MGVEVNLEDKSAIRAQNAKSAVAMFNDGKRYGEISKSLGVGRTFVHDVIRHARRTGATVLPSRRGAPAVALANKTAKLNAIPFGIRTLPVLPSLQGHVDPVRFA